MTPDEFRKLYLCEPVPPLADGPVHVCGRPTVYVKDTASGCPVFRCEHCQMTVHTDPRRLAQNTRIDRAFDAQTGALSCAKVRKMRAENDQQ